MLGQRTQFDFHASFPDGRSDVTELVTQVVYVEEEEDGTEVSYLFGGEEIPDSDLQARFEAAFWTRMSDDEARDVLEIVAVTPPVAAIHDVLLLVGDPTARDEDGNLVPVEAWNFYLNPDDPRLPMFGQRLQFDLLNWIPDEDDEEDEDLDDLDEDVDSEENDPVIPQDIDVWVPSSAAEGATALVVYCSIVDVGEAQVSFWVSSLGDIDGFDLMAAGWEKLGPDTFDPVEFRAAERIDLALRTHLEIRMDPYGEVYLTDFEIQDAVNVSEDQYALLPPSMIEACRAARELLDVDDIVRDWGDSDSDKE
jgi:hypothetical protein